MATDKSVNDCNSIHRWFCVTETEAIDVRSAMGTGAYVERSGQKMIQPTSHSRSRKATGAWTGCEERLGISFVVRTHI